ncbi:hypothetical protein AB6A40_008962 [Gnathostoma spinigerum]|uniref:Uncharacterized protein n=1 Tax=Gnathostoma spinigerum TaxID=75299 RepID=A0ABD6EQM7_9BILA
MTVTSSFVVLLLTSSGILVSIAAATSGEINIKIERHFPCTSATGPSKENLRIKFPSYKTPGVKFVGENENSGHNKCFRMSGGQVQVFEPGLSGSEKYYVHLETRIGIHGKPERCVNADENGCGGIGSW